MNSSFHHILERLNIQLRDRVVVIHASFSGSSVNYSGLVFSLKNEDFKLEKISTDLTKQSCKEWKHATDIEEVVFYLSGDKVLSKESTSTNGGIQNLFPGTDPTLFLSRISKGDQSRIDIVNKDLVEATIQELLDENDLLIGCEFGNSVREVHDALLEDKDTLVENDYILFQGNKVNSNMLWAAAAFVSAVSKSESDDQLPRLERDRNEWHYKKRTNTIAKIAAITSLAAVVIIKMALIWFSAQIDEQSILLALSNDRLQASEMTEQDLKSLYDLERFANLKLPRSLSEMTYLFTECAPLGVELESLEITPMLRSAMQQEDATQLYQSKMVLIQGTSLQLSQINEYLKNLKAIEFTEKVEIIKLKQSANKTALEEFELEIRLTDR